jgi:hypothetical protein
MNSSLALLHLAPLEFGGNKNQKLALPLGGDRGLMQETDIRCKISIKTRFVYFSALMD